MKRVQYFCWIFLTCMAGTFSMAQTLNEVAEALERGIERDQIRAAVLVSYDNGETDIRTFGRLSDEVDTKPDEKTLFEIGSITKVFTVILIQALVDNDKALWDDPISKHLAELDYASPLVAGITLEELGTHTSGLPRLADNMKPEDTLNPYADYDDDALLEFLQSYVPEELDTSYDYSNLGMGVLGFIAARVAEMDYPSALDTFVLSPLGMARTTATNVDLNVENLVLGFSDGATIPQWDFQAVAGAGALVSSGQDLLRFIESSCETNPDGIGQSIQATQTFDTEGPYGLAWNIGKDEEGTKIFWHGGGTGGFASFLAVSPEAQRGWVLLTASTEYALITELGKTLMGTSPDIELDLSAYIGVYELAPNVYLTVTDNDGKLYGQASGQQAIPLTPGESEHSFTFGPAQITVEFMVGAMDRASTLKFVQAGQQIDAKRVADELGIQERVEIAIDPEALLDYVGKYQLAPGLVVTVESRNNQLFVELTGQSAIPVFPMATDHFFYKVVDAEISFLRDDQGRVSTLVLHQNGEHRAPRKN